MERHPTGPTGDVRRRFHREADRLAASPDDLRITLTLVAGELIALDRVEASAAVLVAAGRLFPDLAGFVPRLVGPKHAGVD